MGEHKSPKNGQDRKNPQTGMNLPDDYEGIKDARFRFANCIVGPFLLLQNILHHVKTAA